MEKLYTFDLHPLVNNRKEKRSRHPSLWRVVHVETIILLSQVAARNRKTRSQPNSMICHVRLEIYIDTVDTSQWTQGHSQTQHCAFCAMPKGKSSRSAKSCARKINCKLLRQVYITWPNTKSLRLENLISSYGQSEKNEALCTLTQHEST